jgi:hypothetical protein
MDPVTILFYYFPSEYKGSNNRSTMSSKRSVAIGKCEDGVGKKLKKKILNCLQSFHIREKDIK